jgi:hypothetical protein
MFAYMMSTDCVINEWRFADGMKRRGRGQIEDSIPEFAWSRWEKSQKYWSC